MSFKERLEVKLSSENAANQNEERKLGTVRLLMWLKSSIQDIEERLKA